MANSKARNNTARSWEEAAASATDTAKAMIGLCDWLRSHLPLIKNKGRKEVCDTYFTDTGNKIGDGRMRTAIAACELEDHVRRPTGRGPNAGTKRNKRSADTMRDHHTRDALLAKAIRDALVNQQVLATAIVRLQNDLGTRTDVRLIDVRDNTVIRHKETLTEIVARVTPELRNITVSER